MEPGEVWRGVRWSVAGFAAGLVCGDHLVWALVVTVAAVIGAL